MNKYIKGNTFIEVMLAIAIITVILAVISPAVSSFREKQIIKNATEEVVNLLNEARIDTISAKGGNFYSVRFDSTRAVLFTGSTFVGSDPTNKILTFDTAVTLPSANISLQGSGIDIIFDKLTGNVSTYGTITLELVSNPAIRKIITINKLGVISAD
ncbi:MAG: hypothetical protein QG566_581 [Patescibacteria group bacterium]|nr:hypothetical protein [Patescibacteria group bacterium]